MKSLPRIPLTGIGKESGTTLNSSGNRVLWLGNKLVLMVPSIFKYPLVTPIIFVICVISMSFLFDITENLIIDTSACESTRNVVFDLDAAQSMTT